MNTKRLTILADHLDTVDPGHFNLSIWYSSQWPLRFVENAPETQPECGYVACAIGEAGLLPAFNALHFTLENIFFRGTNKVPVFKTAKHTYTDWEAVRRFFGISETAAEWLFDQEFYPPEFARTTPATVATRIRNYIATGEINYIATGEMK